MSHVSITNAVLNTLKPSNQSYFIRDSNLKGFGIKVNQSGSIKFIAEVWHKGKSRRKTIGAYPLLSIQDAKSMALTFILGVKSNTLNQTNNVTLQSLLDDYVSDGRLKERTIQDYKEAIGFYLSDWLQLNMRQITKEMVLKRFYLIRDKGFNGGIPTYSQATKVMRILSALMNYGMADDVVDSNPVLILKQKRVNRSMVKRTNYLTQEEAREVLNCLTDHPVELAIALMLHTGLRKNEALSLQWSNVGKNVIVIKETKNHREHLIPITENIQEILSKVPQKSRYIFPSPIDKNKPMQYVKATLNRIERRTKLSFRCHDLRRTFATRAAEVGIDYLMIKRLLNHKLNDITSQYIQWNSKQNMEKMKQYLERIVY